MKVIDLLNKIANGEEVPKKIKRYSTVYTYYDGIDYKNADGEFLMGNSVCISYDDLNYELEIIEEDKEIEYLGKQDLYVDDAKGYSVNIEIIGDKINELIKAVNELKKGK